MRELFSRFVGPVVDKVLGLRCTSFGYQYSEIAGSLASVYFCGGDSNLESEDIHVRRARMDCGSCSRKIVETVGSTQSTSTSVQTTAHRSMTACWHCVDGSARR